MVETQSTPVASAEDKATQKLYTYYGSDPDGATKDERCHRIYTDKPFVVLPWHVHKEAPDEGMTDPVWDSGLNGGLGGWTENSGKAQGQILAKAEKAIEDLTSKSAEFKKKNAELDQANAKFDQAFKTMQETQKAGAQQSLVLTQGLQNVMESQKQTAKIMASMQQILVGMKAEQDKKDTGQTPATPDDKKTTDQPATDEKENGGK